MRVWQPRDWLVYARVGVYLTCASLYCIFRPISPTAAIAQWALQGAPALWHRSCIRIPWWYYNFLPAGLRVAQPCQYCLYSMVQNGFFAPQERHVAPINVKFGTPAPPFQISRLSGRKCDNTSPKTVKISNFGQKFVPQGRLVCNIFTKFSVFVRVYR